MDEYPEKGELVIANVERVAGHGAFVNLEEYENKQGIVSIREFSQKWVKNPRDYLKEGQKAVLKVLRVNPERGHIDLSLKAVNDNERRIKLKEYKLNIRVNKLMEYFADQLGKKTDDLYKLFGDRLIDDFGTLYDAFISVANSKEDLSSYIPDDKIREDLIKAIHENIKPTLVTIKGYVTLSSSDPRGVTKVKEALILGKGAIPEDVEGKISYVSSPKYRIDIIADDYKTAERAMKECYESIEQYAEKNDMEFSFDRKLKSSVQ